MLNVVRESKTYHLVKKWFMVLYLSYKATFIYKLFMSDEKHDFSGSIFYKFFEFLKKGFLFINKCAINSYTYKFFQKTLVKTSLKEVMDGSAILDIFKITGDGYDMSFFAFLVLMFSASLIPTMAVVGLIFFVLFLLLLESKFKEKAALSKPIFTDVLIALYLVALFYSFLISKDPERMNVFLIYAAFIGFYYVVRYFIDTKKRVELAFSYFTVSGFFVCLYAFYQYVTGDYGAASWMDEKMFTAIEMRVYSTFMNPNVLGEYLLFLIPISLALTITTKKFMHKAIFGLILICSAVTLFLTYSRGCWIGLIIGMFIFVVLLYPKITVALIALAPFSIFVLPRSIIQRFQSIGNLNDSSTTFRVNIWRGTMSMLEKLWPAGVGLGVNSFQRAYMPYAYSDVVTQHPHNSYLHILCESGIFGLVVFLALFFWVIRQLFLAYKMSESKTLKILSVAQIAGLTGLFVQGFFDSTFYNYRMYLIFFIMIAVSVALSEVAKRSVKS